MSYHYTYQKLGQLRDTPVASAMASSQVIGRWAGVHNADSRLGKALQRSRTRHTATRAPNFQRLLRIEPHATRLVRPSQAVEAPRGNAAPHRRRIRYSRGSMSWAQRNPPGHGAS